ncbi:MAG: Holliday junction branch migration protein RuvA [Ignavibacteria bacterium]|jgi:Holliday junction DNA helicase RuvA
MIGYLTGKIISTKPTHILLDVNGVGYSINITINTFEKISHSEDVKLYIHTNVKEDSISLYGFYEEYEKEMFELLISISGIGPKLALSLLSGIEASELKEAISIGDLTRIVATPGIGRKTAERLILELKGKVSAINETAEVLPDQGVKKEAISALTTLGYNFTTSEQTVRKIISASPEITLEELIKKSLSHLNK